VPIDGILSVGFDKPMEYLADDSDTFPILTEAPTAGRFRERVDTTVASSGKTYTVIYSYHLDAFRLRNRSKRRDVTALPGFWVNPCDDGDTTGFAHTGMDLGTWDYTREQYVMPHRMGDYWQNYQGIQTYPCETIKEVCIFEGTYPDVVEEPLRYVAFDTVLGEIRVQEDPDYQSPYFWESNQRLEWDEGDPATPLPPISQASTTKALLLPMRSCVDVPPCTEVRYRIESDRIYETNPPRLLVMRKHETLRGDLVFLSTVDGILDVPEGDDQSGAEAPTEASGPPFLYRFLVKDTAVEPWHAYAYHAAPAVYVQAKGGYVRDMRSKVTRVVCKGRREPPPIEDVNVTNETAQGLVIAATFATGEFDWSLRVFRDNVEADLVKGAVLFGETVNVTGAGADAIQIDRQGASYVLTYTVDYVSGAAVSCLFRLQHGPYSWIVRGEAS
jgi:hypothetical protein